MSKFLVILYKVLVIFEKFAKMDEVGCEDGTLTTELPAHDSPVKWEIYTSRGQNLSISFSLLSKIRNPKSTIYNPSPSYLLHLQAQITLLGLGVFRIQIENPLIRF